MSRQSKVIISQIGMVTPMRAKMHMEGTNNIEGVIRPNSFESVFQTDTSESVFRTDTVEGAIWTDNVNNLA